MLGAGTSSSAAFVGAQASSNPSKLMRGAGLPMAFGSDLRKYHGMEFELLAKALPQLRSAVLPHAADYGGQWS